MFSERRYARYDNDYDRRPTSALVWLLCALAAGYIIQLVFKLLFVNIAPDLPMDAAAFSPAAVRGLRLWTFASYALLHAGFLHLLVNGLVIYFMGREVLPLLGDKRFLAVSLAAATGGALLWLAVNCNTTHSVLIGASAISLALLILFACFNPDNPITVLLFFIIPVTIRPKYLAAIAIAFDLFGLILFELPVVGRLVAPGVTHYGPIVLQDALPIAHSAHLGGVLVAFAYYFLVHRREWRNPDVIASSLLPEWLRRKKKPAAIASPRYTVNITSSSAPPATREALRAEVDRILDKINTKGFASLTDAEKRTLDSARDVLGDSSRNTP